ncbi:MAG: hypothetical protein COB40_01410 [Marinosulfonomonas sp.]|nr:MAG: hypothetical protein COB40_01410 [Marinosulfonomonas sp.]
MKSVALIYVSTVLLSACQQVPFGAGAGSLPLMSGYRNRADKCVRVGENEFTNQYLEDGADLVGCPMGYEGTGLFVFETEASQLADAQGYVLFSVPRRSLVN